MIRPSSITPPIRRKRLTVLYSVVVLLHLLCIFLPLLYTKLWQPKEQKVNLFRVKIGPAELSSGPRVGMPERARPKSNPPPEPEPDPVPEPEVKPPQPPPVEPVVKVIPKVVPKPAVKPKPVVKPKPAVKPKAKPQPVKKKTKPVARKNTKKNSQNKKKKPARRKEDGVYQGGPSAPYIKNPNVPIGNVDRAQTGGKKFRDQPPGGGAQEDVARYGKNVERYIYFKWKQPPQSRIGDNRPETLVEIVVSPSGKVLGARIVTPSGNQAMEESVRALLTKLDMLPKPPGRGNFRFQLVLKTK